MNSTTLDQMQLWVDALLTVPALNSELRHKILWDVVYKRGNAGVN